MIAEKRLGRKPEPTALPVATADDVERAERFRRKSGIRCVDDINEIANYLAAEIADGPGRPRTSALNTFDRFCHDADRRWCVARCALGKCIRGRPLEPEPELPFDAPADPSPQTLRAILRNNAQLSLDLIVDAAERGARERAS